eukprot:11602446-Ditylum_brightwellii.AAC.1
MGVIEPHVQSFGGTEASSNYTADKVALNTIKRTQEKCVGLKKKENGRKDIKKGTQPSNYMKTSEGGEKMNTHVSLMICSCDDGAYCTPEHNTAICEKEGAIPPF